MVCPIYFKTLVHVFCWISVMLYIFLYLQNQLSVEVISQCEMTRRKARITFWFCHRCVFLFLSCSDIVFLPDQIPETVEASSCVQVYRTPLGSCRILYRGWSVMWHWIGPSIYILTNTRSSILDSIGDLPLHLFLRSKGLIAVELSGHLSNVAFELVNNVAYCMCIPEDQCALPSANIINASYDGTNKPFISQPKYLKSCWLNYTANTNGTADLKDACVGASVLKWDF